MKINEFYIITQGNSREILKLCTTFYEDEWRQSLYCIQSAARVNRHRFIYLFTWTEHKKKNSSYHDNRVKREVMKLIKQNYKGQSWFNKSKQTVN